MLLCVMGVVMGVLLLLASVVLCGVTEGPGDVWRWVPLLLCGLREGYPISVRMVCVVVGVCSVFVGDGLSGLGVGTALGVGVGI
jgi:hypothetical protein